MPRHRRSAVATQLPNPDSGDKKVLTVSRRPECFWRSLFEPPQHLRDPGPADAEIAGESGTVLELAGVEQRLVIAGKLKRISGFLGDSRIVRFCFTGTVPGDNRDNSRST